MTSDRGNIEGAELQLTTPVTPKTAGLNPNASVFLSSKTTSALPEPTTEWEDGTETNEYAYTNGDIGKSDLQGGGFTPVESPLPVLDALTINDNQAVFPVENANTEVEEVIPNEIVSEDQLRQVLKHQLEMCFSRETLASDSYLQSQMDADQYLPIATVANLQQIQELTNNTELITELLRESQNFQVDEKGEKVRPNHNRCIVILREIPNTTPVEEVKELFSGESCPKFVSCEFAHNDNWYVTFDTDADAQQAYQYLRENVKTFLGKPIMARIKAKPLIRMTYPRNGYKRYQQQQQVVQQQQAQQQQAPSPEQSQQQFPVQQVPIMPSVAPFINGQQIPFFTSPAILQSWPTSPTLLDPSMDNSLLLQVLAMNGYQATSVKINPPQNRPPYTNVNRNNRNQKQHRPNNQDRMNAENRLSHDRPQNDRPRTSPRGSDSQIPSHHSYQGQSRRGDNSLNHNHIVHSTVQQSVDNNSNMGISNRQSEGLPPSQRSYRSRRRRDDDGARIPRQSISSSQSISKDNKSIKEPQFDLEINSFPPLPGPGTSSSSSSTAGDIFDSKMSDVVKGTAKPQVRETKPQRVPSPARVPSPPTPPASAAPPSTMVASPPPLPPQQPKEESSSRNSNGSLTGVSVVSSSSSNNYSASITTASPVGTRVPTPPVSPPKPNKASSSSDSQHKNIEPVTTRVLAVPTNAQVKVVDKTAASIPARLSYAQMVQKGKEAEATAELNQPEECLVKGDNSNENGSSSNRANQTLKEQSQTSVKSSTARPPVKDQGRKDIEPKDQRLNSSRRSKENRERRDRRRDRERDGSRSSNK